MAQRSGQSHPGRHWLGRAAVPQPGTPLLPVAKGAHGRAEVEGVPGRCPGLLSDVGDLLRQVKVGERHGDSGVEGSAGRAGTPRLPSAGRGELSTHHVQPALGAPASLRTAALPHAGLPHQQDVGDGGQVSAPAEAERAHGGDGWPAHEDVPEGCATLRAELAGECERLRGPRSLDPQGWAWWL